MDVFRNPFRGLVSRKKTAKVRPAKKRTDRRPDWLVDADEDLRLALVPSKFPDNRDPREPGLTGAVLQREHKGPNRAQARATGSRRNGYAKTLPERMKAKPPHRPLAEHRRPHRGKGQSEAWQKAKDARLARQVEQMKRREAKTRG